MPPTLFSTCLFTLVFQQKEINYCGGSFAPFLLWFHGTSSQSCSGKMKLLFLNFQLTTSAQTPTMNEPVFSSLNAGVSPGFFPDLYALILLHTISLTPKASVQWSFRCRGLKNSYVSSREYFWYFICQIYINIHRCICIFAYMESIYIYMYGLPDLLTCTLYPNILAQCALCFHL